MKRKFRYFSLLAGVSVFSLSSLAFTACSGGSSDGLATIRLDQTHLNMDVGYTSKLRVSVTSKSLSTSEVKWISTNENAVVVRGGTVFAIGAGDAEVHAFLSGAGNLATCYVTVEDNEGPVTPKDPSLRLNVTNLNVSLGGSSSLTAYYYPSSTKVTYRSDDESIAKVSAEGVVTGVHEGTTVITATGDVDPAKQIATCIVVVSDSGEVPVVVPDDEKHLTGSIKVGVPSNQTAFVTDLLDKFNELTESTVSFSTVKWEEDKAAENMGTPADGPDVFPYASDQTLRLYARKALAVLPTENVTWISDNMGAEAKTYATLKGINKVVGYPFAGDNGPVMFYDKSVVSNPDEINTIDKLFAKCEELSPKREVNFDLVNGFYAAGAFMTFNGGESLYNLVAKEGGTFSSRATFNSEAGKKGAKLMSSLFAQPRIMGAADAPTATTRVLATITDASKVASFKKLMGANYAVAPLPMISDQDPTRIGIYIGYKFYGVNPSKGGGADHLKLQHIVAKYLAGEYCQTQRFQEFATKPTLTSLSEIAKNEPHINALNIHIANKHYVPLTAVDVALWSQTMSAAKSIKTAGAGITDDQIEEILQSLDEQLYVK